MYILISIFPSMGLAGNYTQVIKEFIFPLSWNMKVSDLKSTFNEADVTAVTDDPKGKTFLIYGIETAQLGSVYIHVHYGSNEKINKIVMSSIEMRKECGPEVSNSKKPSFCRDVYGPAILSLYDNISKALEDKLGKGEPNRLVSDHLSVNKQKSLTWVYPNIDIILSMLVDEEGLWSVYVSFPKKKEAKN